MKKIEKDIRERLFELADPEYKAFHSKLIPNVEEDRVIGVRTPQLRKLTKELTKNLEASEIEEFLNSLPHYYYEENNVHGFLLETVKDFEKCVQELDQFLPYVDNWATCDMMSPKVLGKHLPETLEQIRRWMTSKDTYTCRFGIKILMTYFLDDQFQPEYLKWVEEIQLEEYYIKMMQAWFFATALAKQYEAVLPILEEKRLGTWVHNKTIQKARESFRVQTEQKEYLKSLRIK